MDLRRRPFHVPGNICLPPSRLPRAVVWTVNGDHECSVFRRIGGLNWMGLVWVGDSWASRADETLLAALIVNARANRQRFYEKCSRGIVKRDFSRCLTSFQTNVQTAYEIYVCQWIDSIRSQKRVSKCRVVVDYINACHRLFCSWTP